MFNPFGEIPRGFLTPVFAINSLDKYVTICYNRYLRLNNTHNNLISKSNPFWIITNLTRKYKENKCLLI